MLTLTQTHKNSKHLDASDLRKGFQEANEGGKHVGFRNFERIIFWLSTLVENKLPESHV